MSKLNRVLAAIGVLYLLTVGVLYLVLNERNENFTRNGEMITGTVVRVEPYGHGSTGPWRPLMHDSRRRVAIIRYTDRGQEGVTMSNPYKSPKKYAKGDSVTLVIHRGSAASVDDDVVAVKDGTMTALRVMPWTFIAAGVLAAWYFGVRTHPELFTHRRRPKVRRDGPALPVTQG